MALGFYIGLAGLTVLLYVFSKRPQKNTVLPPGPKPIPILGNIRDLVSCQPWLVATDWAKEFGSVCYVHVFGQGLVFLNTSEAAFELLDKRGSIYSDRPHLVMLGELCGCNNIMPLTAYGDQFRRQRKLVHRAFSSQVIPDYHPMMETETQLFLQRVMDSPSNYMDHILRYAGALTLRVLYGYNVTSNEDKVLLLAEECVSILTNRVGSGSGIWPVDVLPFLRHMPTWFPGASFKRNAIEWRAKLEELATKPYEFVKISLAQGIAVPSSCSTMFEEEHATPLDEEEEFDIKWASNSMYIASVDTTATAARHFVLAMVLHPEVLMKAQKEIDSVVGSSRLPSFSDRPSLPFIDAVMNETLRWGAVVPLNVAHRLTEDDTYNGMLIPKGSFIIANIWAMLRDESLFPDSHTFNPERYMEKGDPRTEKRKDPRNYAFGFGRRRCPGANLIDSSVWLLIACMAATFDISKAVDESGNVLEPEVVFDNPMIRTPNQFRCDIRLRSEQCKRLLQHDVSEAPS